ncbi:MAG: hypothetical protein GC145_01510 [Caulobacter sp.]|nr:hypothetical protein [Caulobacter sp.]
MSRLLITAAATAALLALAACDGGPASKPARVQTGAPTAAEARASAGESAVETAAAAVDGPDSAAPAVDPRTQPVPLLDGKPMWAANRRLTAEEAARKQFDRNGEAFGAKSVKDYARKAHAFVENPPAGVETIKRAYGTIMYDAKSNTFVATDRNGVPRAMFKPDDGPAYWAQQKERGERGGNGRRRNRDDG